MTGHSNLETDIRLARQSRLPVLITAPPDRALAVAHAIADGGNGQTPTMAVCDGAALVGAAWGERRAGGTSGPDMSLVVLEVHTLSDDEQAALMQVLVDERELGRQRVIATSSVCLWRRVVQGRFDATLFYRLNAIHIVSHPGSECASRPGCSKGSGGYFLTYFFTAFGPTSAP